MLTFLRWIFVRAYAIIHAYIIDTGFSQAILYKKLIQPHTHTKTLNINVWHDLNCVKTMKYWLNRWRNESVVDSVTDSLGNSIRYGGFGGILRLFQFN